jgi:lysophospholipase L1-like esterase
VPKKYLALGDSYTIGQSVALQERFPHQTAAWLRLKGIQMNEPDYIATTGWTTANLLSAIAAQKPATNYDAVSLLIGVNNQYQQRDTQEYRSQFTQCLLKAIELANNQRNRVFVLSIPDYSATPFASRLDRQKISREIDIFNAINKQVCTEYAIVWIEITQSSRDALTNPLLVANDGLHPSGMEYAKWAAKLAPAMETVLK